MALVIYDHGYRIQTPVSSVLPARVVEQLTELQPGRGIPSSDSRLNPPEAEIPGSNRQSPGNKNASQQGERAQQAYRQTERLKRRESDTPNLAVDRIMTSPVVTIAAGAKIADAWQLMNTHRLRHLAVVNPAGKIMGILTERDLLRRHTLMPHAGPHNPRQNIDGGYSTQLIVATADTLIREVALVMHEKQLSCVPIVDGAGKPVGIVTRSDLLPLIINDKKLEQWA
ncbi:HPP family protein [Motiliproteus sp. MSK22-1]|uniref:CBS domain-containing protein n=1 Tax=Motiliproteus sp. MSK22-1 TaxID=1897630 RepID=UPI000977E701|nr:CBS domain-containing protein [Motiliproteus sp. MSK22-1]OMH30071.1 hypothetical protein BGP75_19265 [Motiliproteus sp. MSK22-1]